MSANTSPIKSTESDDIFKSDATFNADINRKMRVPHKISMGDYDDDIPNGINPTWNNSYFNINMQVPERILVAGQEQHIGTRAPPREMVLDNSIMPRDPESVRVYTPPRVITLDKYSFPVVGDKTEDNPHKDVVPAKPKPLYEVVGGEFRILHSESTSPVPSGNVVSAAEEIRHLRRQMAKLQRRVVAIELENINRIQKEKFIYGLGIAYFLLKAIIWLRRS